MKQRKNFTKSLSVATAGAIFICLGTAKISSAALFTLQGGPQTFDFVNPLKITATDFHLEIVPGQAGVAIGQQGTSGGTPFPNTNIAEDGGEVTFSGGLGIPADGTYTFKFNKFPKGTLMDAKYSYPKDFQPALVDPKIPNKPSKRPPDGTVAVPEPSSVLGIITIGAFSASLLLKKTRKREKVSFGKNCQD